MTNLGSIYLCFTTLMAVVRATAWNMASLPSCMAFMSPFHEPRTRDAHFPKHSLEYSLNFWSQSKKKTNGSILKD